MDTMIMQRNALFDRVTDAVAAVDELLKDATVLPDSVHKKIEPTGIRILWQEQMPVPYWKPKPC